MDAYSSSEDLSVKARKPYTITKQRERWTEEEHNRFLEAVKLYGRAWQRIEEHIGTKTAVQIRSHAQKFFSKLEKEASMKGIPLGQAIDIEIPPPRPKRKPSNPYPRKTGTVGVTTVQPGLKEGKQVTLASSNNGERAFDREKVPLPEKPVGDCGQGNAEQKRDDGKSSDALSLSHEASSALEASLDKNFMPKSAASLVRSPCDFGKFVSMKKHGSDKKACDGSHVTNGSYGKHEPDEPDVAETVHDNATERDIQFAKKFPRHVPVHILNGSLGARTPAFSSDVSYQEYAVHQVGVHGHPAFFASPAVSAPVERQECFHASRFTSHQKVPSSCQPFPPSLNIQEDYFSFLQMSSTFSSLIISTLLQNPAAYAAASFAASFWPSTNAEASAESPAGSVGGFSPSPMNSAPSMAAIAAATVAAATAWWEAHGLLPLCAPMNGGFTYPAPASAAPTRNSQTAIVSQETEENNFHAYASQNKRQTVQELSEASPAPSLSLKSGAAAASVSKDSAAAKLNKRLTSHDDEQKGATETNQKNSVKSKNKKQVDRSSCGSNTTSSSEVETDALEKHENDDDGPKEPDQNHSCADTDNRGSRNLSYATDSWKEVSDEGRMAFQALFLREVLPQSFSPAHDEEHQKNDATEDRQNVVKSSDDASGLDLNSNTSESSSDHHGIENSGSRDEDNVKMLTIGLGQAKPKARRTGFKPYKRCSVESRVATANGEQEEGSKRIRLDGEASI